MMRVLIQPAVATFFITVFSLGALMCLVNVYLFVYLADMGGTSTLFGLSLAVTCIAEIPFFFFSERLLKRFSPSAVILFSICVYSLRFIYYSFITNPWAVLPAELLHGITYAACWAAQTEFVSQVRFFSQTNWRLTGTYGDWPRRYPQLAWGRACRAS